MTRMTVSIGGTSYTLISEDDEAHIKKCAELVDRELAAVKGQGMGSALSSAVLAAMNIADRYYKEGRAGENLRAQLKDYAEENARLRAELSRQNKKA